jgi:hypothetical protein
MPFELTAGRAVKFERSPLAEDYARYKQRTGRFLPKI